MAVAVLVAKTGNADIDGLLSGDMWSGTVTYSFSDSPSDYSYTGEPTATGFAQIPLAEQQAVNYAIGLISSYTNLNVQFAGTGTADTKSQSLLRPIRPPTPIIRVTSSAATCGSARNTIIPRARSGITIS